MVFFIVKGHISLSINGGNSLIFASNLLMSLSGLGHSITPCTHIQRHQLLKFNITCVVKTPTILPTIVLQKKSCLYFVQQLIIYSHAGRRYNPSLQVSFTIQCRSLNNMPNHQVIEMHNVIHTHTHTQTSFIKGKENNRFRNIFPPLECMKVREDHFWHVLEIITSIQQSPWGSEVPIRTRSQGTSSFSRNHTIVPTWISWAWIYDNTKNVRVRFARYDGMHLVSLHYDDKSLWIRMNTMEKIQIKTELLHKRTIQ